MKDFFVIGCEDPSFRLSYNLLNTAGFKGIVWPEGKMAQAKYFDTVLHNIVAAMPSVSLGGFLNYARKNPGVTLVSFYNFSAGKRFVQKLRQSARKNFHVIDYYNFALERNVPLVFMPAQDERATVLNADKEWATLRAQLTDEFSRFSLDCYLQATKQRNTEQMLPAYIDMEHKIVNRLSRKLSFVPRPDEIYVDIGAWDGDTVTKFVDIAGTYKAIHAFEPASYAFGILEKRKFYLDDFHAHAKAVSNFNGEIEFIDVSAPSSRPMDINMRLGDVGQNENMIRVPCVKLDDLLDEATLIKIEVEGYETRVLEGAQNLIRKCKPDCAVYSYHFPLDPFHIVEKMNAIHKYKHVALRFHAPDQHNSIVYFSDRTPFE